jgi:hypothetical protein
VHPRVRLTAVVVVLCGAVGAAMAVLVGTSDRPVGPARTVPAAEVRAQVRSALTKGPQRVDFGPDVPLREVRCTRGATGGWRCAAMFANGIEVVCVAGDPGGGMPRPTPLCPD